MTRHFAIVAFSSVLLIFLPGTESGLAAPPPQVLVDVTDRANVTKYVTNDCSIRVVQSGSRPALQLAFGHVVPWPHLRFMPGRLEYRTDWSKFALLAVTVSNPTDVGVDVDVRVDSALTAARGRQGWTTVMPHETVRLLLPLNGRRNIVGMRGQPPLQYARKPIDVQVAHNQQDLDTGRITQFQVFMGRPDRDHTILLHRVELIPADVHRAAEAFVDRFGQYNGADWPGKLHDEREFAERLRAEQAYFAANPPLPDRDQYGGWAEGPQLEASGRFRVEKHGGKWWLVDPAGRLFWSSGITCVRFNAETIIAGRGQCYEWLPIGPGPLARFYTSRGRMFDFFKSNAFRKYGDDYRAKFYDVTMKRLQSWGVNTIANWSDPDSWRMKRVPYTIPVHPPDVPMFVATSHMKAGLEKKKWFPDPFDPKFREGLARALVQQSEFKSDPWLLGVFIHNEFPWTLGAPWRSRNTLQGIAALCLQKNKDTLQVKRQLVEWLQERHGSVANLNQIWGTTFTSWKVVANPFELTSAQHQRALPDLTELDRLIARQYFQVCREAMDEHFPGVLYLGCRFSGAYNRHIVEVAREYCDVVTFNIYEEAPSDRTADELATELDFPVLIGEFHFGALDRGMFDPGLRRAKDQVERAEKYANYVRQAAAAPWCVGAHWFQYLDQPLTGRRDGENYNIGFVDATDDPYPEMRDAARQLHTGLYRLRHP